MLPFTPTVANGRDGVGRGPSLLPVGSHLCADSCPSRDRLELLESTLCGQSCCPVTSAADASKETLPARSANGEVGWWIPVIHPRQQW
jgi:hypothetical protein